MALNAPIRPALGYRDAVLFDMDGTLLFLPVDMDRLRGQLEQFHRRYGLNMTFRPLTDNLAEAARRLQKLLPRAEARAAIRWAQAQVAQAEVEAAALARDLVNGRPPGGGAVYRQERTLRSANQGLRSCAARHRYGLGRRPPVSSRPRRCPRADE